MSRGRRPGRPRSSETRRPRPRPRLRLDRGLAFRATGGQLALSLARMNPPGSHKIMDRRHQTSRRRPALSEREKNAIIAGVLLADAACRARPDDRRARHADDRRNARPCRVPALDRHRLSPGGDRHGAALRQDLRHSRPPADLYAAIAIFLVGSLVCALAPTMLVLIIGRGLQGIGGGGLFALSQTVIGDLVPPRERARYASWVAGTWAVAEPRRPPARRLFRRPSALVADLLDQPAARHLRHVHHLPAAEEAVTPRRRPPARLRRRVLLVVATA